MPLIAVEDVTTELARMKAYLQERLPEGWKVKNKGLAEVSTLGTEIATAIDEEATTGEIHDKKRVHRNSKINELHAFQVDCRAAVKLEFSEDSPEYQAIPWGDPEESGSTPKPGQPEQNQ